MVEEPRGFRLPNILSRRERFLEADMRLGEILQRFVDRAATREDCLLALVGQQRAYDYYVRAVLDTVGLLRDTRL